MNNKKELVSMRILNWFGLWLGFSFAMQMLIHAVGKQQCIRSNTVIIVSLVTGAALATLISYHNKSDKKIK